MPQPQAYDRTVDFTQRDGDDTDHGGINAELDAAATSINGIRDNLALIQNDDGGLANGIVTPDSLTPEVFEALTQDISDQVTSATSSAQSALTSAISSAASAAAAAASQVAATTSENAAALNASGAATSASAAQASQTAAAASAAAALVSQNAAAASASAASTSAGTATTQAGIATTQAGTATTQATNAATSATTATTQAGIATTQAGTATTQAGIATTQAGTATTQATAAAASAAAAAASAASITLPIPIGSGGTGVTSIAALRAALGIYDAETGDLQPTMASAARAGWVMASGRTIGNASSSATERANADTSALFTMLWTNLADAEAPVSGGRGASAAADFAANKTITLPDLRGRAIVGKDNMGGATASRITSAGAGIDGTVLGKSGGAQTHTLTEAQSPPHVHAQNIGSNNGTSGGSPIGASGSNAGGAGFSTGSAGGGAAHNNTQPSYIANVMVKL